MGYAAQFILRQAGRLGLCACVFLAAAAAAPAQEPLQPLPGADAQLAGQQAAPLEQTPATLHGIVRDSATGEPLPRVLVSIEGDAATGVLTDGDGRFEIANLPTGPVIVTVRKPGYLDSAETAAAGAMDSVPAASHNVMVAADMPDVEFTLTPTGAIRGQVDLSSGDPAEGITLNLVKRVVMDGRAGWLPTANTKTHSDGAYRFGGLAAGVYALSTDPSLDASDLNLLVQQGRGGAAHKWGYAAVYYPGVRDPSGAAVITVEAGETEQANLTLAREPFQTVTATAVLPQAMTNSGLSYSATVSDIAGHALPYPARYDSSSKMIQATLPDGSYRLAVTTMPQIRAMAMIQASLPDGSYRLAVTTMPQIRAMAADGGLSMMNSPSLEGSVDFQVAGQPVTNLRVGLTEPAQTQVQLNLLRSGSGVEPSMGSQVVVTASSAMAGAGQISDDNMVSILATGQIPGPLVGQPVPPGSYWVHTASTQKAFCESSFTAGGANLAREPLVVGQAGVQAPLELTLRDDCAKLTLSLPETLEVMAPGEEKFYTVYAVPDFDSTVDPQPVTLRPSSGGIITLDGLTPGNYHVYTFEGNASFEYRNPAALAAAQSQAVTLSPGETADLVVQTPGQ